MNQYFEWEGFQNLYLEDSFVLDVTECNRHLSFTVELVLTEGHPSYEPPRVGEQYCYRKGKIVFEEIEQIEWRDKKFQPFMDADNSKDFGNIDSFFLSDRGYKLSGDWGEVIIRSRPPRIVWLE